MFCIQIEEEVTFEILKGNKILNEIYFAAQLLTNTTRKYPYLVNSTLADEFNFLLWFTKFKSGTLVIAYYKNKPVGYIRCIPMMDYKEKLSDSIEAFKNVGLNPKNCYFTSTLLVSPEYRGNKIGKKLLNFVEKHAQKLGYTYNCFINKKPEKSHQLRPVDYKDSEFCCAIEGYTMLPCTIKKSWLTIQANGNIEKQEHMFHHWTKKL